MCFEYEQEYGVCWDALLIGEDEESLIYLLREEYNVQVTDQKEFTRRLFKLFEELHTDGIIQPDARP